MPLHQSCEIPRATDDHESGPVAIHSARGLTHETCKIGCSSRGQGPEHHHERAHSRSWSWSRSICSGSTYRSSVPVARLEAVRS